MSDPINLKAPLAVAHLVLTQLDALEVNAEDKLTGVEIVYRVLTHGTGLLMMPLASEVEPSGETIPFRRTSSMHNSG
jgi:hypothetical protein